MYVCIYIYIYIYIIMETMCPPNYHHNGFVATHARGHKAIVVITGKAHCLHDYIHIKPILLLWDLSTLCVVNLLNHHLKYIYIERERERRYFWTYLILGKCDWLSEWLGSTSEQHRWINTGKKEPHATESPNCYGLENCK